MASRVWSSIAPPPLTDSVLGLVYGNGVFCVLDASGNTYVSSDKGASWSGPYPTGLSNIRGMAFDGEKFCIIAAFGARSRVSFDGMSWTGGSMPATCNWLVGVDGAFYAVSGSSVYRSYNGVSWTSIATLGSDLDTIAYGNGLFIVCKWTGIEEIFVSSDATTWDVVDASDGVPSSTPSVVWDGTNFVMFDANDRSSVHTSPDGYNWTYRPGIIPTPASGGSAQERTIVVDAGDVLRGYYDSIFVSAAGATSPWVVDPSPSPGNFALGAGALGDGVILFIAFTAPYTTIKATSLDVPPGVFWADLKGVVEIP